jgi:hypothetical protein
MCNAQPIDALTPAELSIEIGIRKHPRQQARFAGILKKVFALLLLLSASEARPGFPQGLH